MIGFQIITARPADWDTKKYRMYRRVQNAVMHDYLRGLQPNQTMHSYLLNAAPYPENKIKQAINKVFRPNPSPSAPADPGLEKVKNRDRTKIAKAAAWIILAAIATVILIANFI